MREAVLLLIAASFKIYNFFGKVKQSLNQKDVNKQLHRFEYIYGEQFNMATGVSLTSQYIGGVIFI